MADVPPPEQPGWYADARGAWWWWDGRSWTSAAIAAAGVGRGADRNAERSLALVMWIVYIVGGGFISSLIFYFVAKDKPFVRHHAAESLNLTLALLLLQVPAVVLVAPVYIDLLSQMGESSASDPEFTGAFVAGILLLLVATALNYVLAIVGAVHAHKGRWRRLPVLIHPVRGVVGPGQEPYPVEP